MKKINLRGISEILNESEMKDVKGGVLTYVDDLDLDLAGEGPESGLGGNGRHSLKCFNADTSCWVDACPRSRADAEAMCLKAKCGGEFGIYISCA